MARDVDPSSAAANPVAAGSDNAFIDRASNATRPTVPISDPTAPNPGGLKGGERLRQILNGGPKDLKSPTYDAWILALPEDANDSEYTSLLRELKGASQRRQSDRAGKAPSDVGLFTSENGAVWRERLRRLGIDVAEPGTPAEAGNDGGGASSLLKTGATTDGPGSPPFPWAPDAGKTGPTSATSLLKTDSAGGPAGSLPFAWPPDGSMTPKTANPDTAHQQDRVQKELDTRDEGEQQRKYREKIGTKPIIMGLQVNDNDALVGNNPDNPGGTPDGYISQWAHQQGLSLDNEHAQRAARNGSWVYQGEIADPAGGPGFTRSIYVHVDDAVSQMSGLSTEQIKSYQHMMKNPETGIVDAELHNLWKEAVARASDYARQGKKVTLDFIFQQLLSAKVKSGAGRGGGGGGSGPFGNESGADMVGANYYQAMMQILGDVSGVK